MSIDSWLVEEAITLDPRPDPRQSYIRLLQQVIDALKEERTVKIGDETEIIPIYTLPTIIFAYLDTESKDVLEGQALAQLYCYRDRREFLKDLVSYGDEDYLKEFGLAAFIGKAESSSTSLTPE